MNSQLTEDLHQELRQLEAETFEIEDVEALDQSLLTPVPSCSCCSSTSTSSCSSTSCNG